MTKKTLENHLSFAPMTKKRNVRLFN